MSDQEQKSLWNSHQSHVDLYQPSGSQSGLPTPGLYSSSSYGTTSHAGHPHSLPNLANINIYGEVRSPLSTGDASQAHSVGSHLSHGSMAGRDILGQDVSIEHRDSVVMPSSSSKSDAVASSQTSDDEKDDDDDDDGSDSDEPKEEGDDRQLTAAEIRQQKRKMKRFRLTHTQTRFLMSEFARDAHPDAAHRDRLSNEIPGLSPRQVQVWFQNRRAKLKRMSAEDRDRMMRSRALPEHFGMPQAANQPFLQHPPAMQNSTPRLLQNPHLNRYGEVRPLTLDTAGRSGNTESSFASPTSVTPALGSFSFTPPQSATETHSPMSGGGDYGPFGYRSIASSPRRSLLSPGHSSTPSASNSLPSTLMRIPALDRPRQSSVDVQPSGFRPALASYPGVQASPSLLQQHDRRSSAPHARLGLHREMAPPSTPVGLGFSFDSLSNYQTSGQAPLQAQSQPQPPLSAGATQLMYGGGGSAVSSSASTGSYPAYLDYSGSSGHGGSAHNYSTQQASHYQPAGFGSQYGSQLSNHSYGQSTENLQSYPSMQGMSSPFGSRSGHGSFPKREEGEQVSSESGTPITGHHSY
ncbi:hypothetical protein K461DRAFT_292514 [Myriangium duriaei CBS 260.36]|uniref:Homeobox domain-containing protein n=1 Tax=Myriangium duriaei CBS 260.36 TaxID=1168546 RepID=A0A9P4J5Y5_9PEZI|nr:hypothetical protein K461DRAFT_292514 [Myriangium duriaei CBS 260.36]